MSFSHISHSIVFCLLFVLVQHEPWVKQSSTSYSSLFWSLLVVKFWWKKVRERLIFQVASMLHHIIAIQIWWVHNMSQGIHRSIKILMFGHMNFPPSCTIIWWWMATTCLTSIKVNKHTNIGNQCIVFGQIWWINNQCFVLNTPHLVQ
jgi:glucose-6-phosphate-specific signal transduction histidine kinase